MIDSTRQRQSEASTKQAAMNLPSLCLHGNNVIQVVVLLFGALSCCSLPVLCSAFSPKTPLWSSPRGGGFSAFQQQRRMGPFGRRTGLTTKTTTTSTSARRMFTGIVEEMGTVVDLKVNDAMTLWDGSTGSGTELTIQSNDGIVMKDSYLGCSICVSGVCLTATKLNYEKQQFTVGLAPETLRKTYFDTGLSVGDAVNLERASEIGGRNSGHFVQGHVDNTGTIIDRWIDEDSLFFKVKVDAPELITYIVPKGFIAIDGTSLTVVDVNISEQWFTFMLVSYTQKKIIIPSKQVGDKVNLEVDVLGKYSENTIATSIIPRLEALEAKVASLEKQLNGK